jgi:hypothetical protein
VVETKVRGSRAVEETKDEPKFVEVKLLKKTQPLYLYERDDERSEDAILDDKGKVRAPEVLVLKPKRDEEGNLIDQTKILLGTTDDKFGRKIPVYKEVLDPAPAGAIIPLPVDAALKALKDKVAEVTGRTVLG